MNKVRAAVVRKWRWARSSPLFWWNLLLVGGCVLIVGVWRAPDVGGLPSDFRVRVWGLLLQIAGGIIVLVDLTSAASAHGRRGVWRAFSDWVQEGLRGRNVVVRAESAEMTLVAGRARAIVRSRAAEGADLDYRVRCLEENAVRVDKDVQDVFDALAAVEGGLKAAVADEARYRKEDVDALRRELHDAVTGKFHLLLFGAFWVLIGVVLATMAPEIALAAAGRWADLAARA